MSARQPHRHPLDPPRITDTDQAEKTMGADRHRAEAMGEQEVETGRARRVAIEVVSRPAAGHLGVAVPRYRLYRYLGCKMRRGDLPTS